jgi:biotin synthase
MVGNKVYFRGLIEYSNKCSRNCHYCGIRCGNNNVVRYEMTRHEVLEAALFAHSQKMGSVVIQSGERNDSAFIKRIGELVESIRLLTYGDLKVTLSCGEQTEETYRYWRECGASRYLLRIETTNTELFKKLHPNDGNHLFSSRLRALGNLKKCGYQTGTGVMIGIPGQSLEMLAMDLVFFKNFNVDMIGMGPYIEHPDSCLPNAGTSNLSLKERLELSLRMIALLRLLMPDINITSATALQAIDEYARLEAINCGANVIMPNISPLTYRRNYLLYDHKPGLDVSATENISYWNQKIHEIHCNPAWSECGDPLHYYERTGMAAG